MVCMVLYFCIHFACKNFSQHFFLGEFACWKEKLHASTLLLAASDSPHTPGMAILFQSAANGKVILIYPAPPPSQPPAHWLSRIHRAYCWWTDCSSRSPVQRMHWWRLFDALFDYFKQRNRFAGPAMEQSAKVFRPDLPPLARYSAWGLPRHCLHFGHCGHKQRHALAIDFPWIARCRPVHYEGVHTPLD